mgnify:CR=1 FL=1
MMSKVAIVYWSGTGNTEQMAQQVAEGAAQAGAEVSLFSSAEFGADQMDAFSAVAFGCPSMGSEQLEESEFAPMFENCLPELSGRTIALFGSVKMRINASLSSRSSVTVTGSLPISSGISPNFTRSCGSAS